MTSYGVTSHKELRKELKILQTSLIVHVNHWIRNNDLARPLCFDHQTWIISRRLRFFWTNGLQMKEEFVGSAINYAWITAYLMAGFITQRADSWWRHQMETFPCYWPFVRGIHRSQRPVTRSFDVSLICSWINSWVNSRDAGDLRRHRAHYDDTLMCYSF